MLSHYTTNILQSETLGGIDSLLDEILSNKAKVNNITHHEDPFKTIIDDILIKVNRAQMQIFLNKVYLASEFYYEWINKIDAELTATNDYPKQQALALQKEKDLLSEKLSFVYTMRSFATIKIMENSQDMDELEKLNQALNNKYSHFKECIKNFKKYQCRYFNSYKITDQNEITNENLQHWKVNDFPFTFACERLNSLLRNVKNKNDSGRYFEDEKDNEAIALILSTLVDINQAPGSENEKLQKMEQFLLQFYFKIRKEQGRAGQGSEEQGMSEQEMSKVQGKYESASANLIEYFLASPWGMNLSIKYGDEEIVPHQIKLKAEVPVLSRLTKMYLVDEMLLLLTMPTFPDNENSAALFKRIVNKLSPKPIYLNNRETINELIHDLYSIQSNTDNYSLSEFESEFKLKNDVDENQQKIFKMQNAIVDLFSEVNKQANGEESFFGGIKTSFAHLLGKILKKEFGLSAQDIENKLRPKDEPQLGFSFDH